MLAPTAFVGAAGLAFVMTKLLGLGKSPGASSPAGPDASSSTATSNAES
jgi:hypothetical protein